jgi:hypothetical protein
MVLHERLECLFAEQDTTALIMPIVVGISFFRDYYDDIFEYLI